MMIKGGIRIGGLNGKRTASTLLGGLLAYWKLDTNSWLDSSGNGHTLFVTNGSSANITIETGRITNSAGFNANGTFLENEDFVFPNSWTISLWIYVDSNITTCVGSCFPSFFDFGYYAGARIRFVEQDGAGGANQGWINSNTPGEGGNYGQFYAWGIGQWRHICITQNTSGLKWYINNSFYASDEEDPATERSGTGLTIGAQNGEDFYGAQGDYRICEYGVWDRALTGAEITSLYNAGAGNTYPFNN
jgi:hypothetical protein